MQTKYAFFCKQKLKYDTVTNLITVYSVDYERHLKDKRKGYKNGFERQDDGGSLITYVSMDHTMVDFILIIIYVISAFGATLRLNRSSEQYHTSYCEMGL